MDPLLLPWTKPLQHVSTLVRQFLFDFIILVENCVLLGYAVNSNIIELQENKTVFVIVLLGFQMVGLILKCVYYRYVLIDCLVYIFRVQNLQIQSEIPLLYFSAFFWSISFA